MLAVILGGRAHPVERNHSRHNDKHHKSVSLNIAGAGASFWLSCRHKGPPSIRAKSLQDNSDKQSGGDFEALWCLIIKCNQRCARVLAGRCVATSLPPRPRPPPLG